MDKILFFGRVFDTEKGQSVLQRQAQLVERIKQIELNIFDKWAQAIPTEIHLHTANHLLDKCDEGRWRVNFNEKVCTMREARACWQYKIHITKYWVLVCVELFHWFVIRDRNPDT